MGLLEDWWDVQQLERMWKMGEPERVTMADAETLALQQLEKIAKAIQALEGLPVDFRLATKLSDVLADISTICAPK